MQPKNLFGALLVTLFLLSGSAGAVPSLVLDCDSAMEGVQDNAIVDPGSMFRIDCYGTGLEDLDTFDVEVVLESLVGDLAVNFSSVQINSEFGGSCGYLQQELTTSVGRIVVTASAVGKDPTCAPDGVFRLFSLYLNVIGVDGDVTMVTIPSARFIDTYDVFWDLSPDPGLITTAGVVSSGLDTWSHIKAMFK